MSPRLTVILPTRERHDTLIWALKTCVTQDCDDLEILVSDNASVDETREVVASYDDPRIRYVNPGSRLGMSEHWEFALSHVREGYVTFLGDDDGLMPAAASEITGILAADGGDALIWPLASYYWPQFYDPAMANCLSMPIPQSTTTREIDSRTVLRDLSRFAIPHYLLPSPYWGAVSHEALERVRARGGRVFGSINPDLYSGTAVAAVTDRYLRSDRIQTLSGVSAHSTGASHMTGKDRDAAESPKTAFAAENTIAFHPSLDFASNVSICVAESLAQVHDQIDQTVPEPDLELLVRAALRHPDHVINPAVQAETVAALTRTAQRHHLEEVLAEELHPGTLTTWGRRAAVASQLLLRGNPLHDCSAEGARTIYDATLVAERVREAASSRSGSAWVKLRGRGLKARRALGSARRRLAA